MADFINERDYLKVIQPAHLAAISVNDATFRKAAEEAAMLEAGSHLSRGRYDIPAIFAPIDRWLQYREYSSGDRVVYEPTPWSAAAYNAGDQVTASVDGATWIVEAATATTASESPASHPQAWRRVELSLGLWLAHDNTAVGERPAAGSGPWHQNDGRHRLVVMFVVDIAIWHLLARTDPSAVPEMRAARYQQALEWFHNVAKGAVTDPFLPTLASPEVAQSGFHMQSRPPVDFTL